MLLKVGGFVSGTALSSLFVANMDDVIYGQLRRNVVLPFKHVFMGPQPSLDEILELGSGTANFVSQFKPRSLGMHNARALLVDET